MDKFNKALDQLSQVVPTDVIEYIKGSFAVSYSEHKIAEMYDRAEPEFKGETDGDLNKLFCDDKLSEKFGEIESLLWNRACVSLNNWLHSLYCESL